MAGTFQIVSPVDETLHRTGHFLSQSQALAKLSLASEAQKTSAALSPIERAALCRAFLDAFESRLEKAAADVSELMGKPLAEARGEIATMRARTEALCRHAPTVLMDQALAPTAGLERFVRAVPLGTVMDIAAWNYPFIVATNVVIPAVLAGNAVVLKHAPQTFVVGQAFEQAFLEAGAPEGLVQDFMVDHELAAEMIATRRIHHVGFTGSTRGGAEVYRAVAAGGFASAGLEMGGKDAALLLSDVDLEKTAASLVEGAFYNAGQSCCAVERIYVPRSLYKEFVEAFVAETHKLKLGNPLITGTTLGPVVSARAAARIVEQRDAALAGGAQQVSSDARFLFENATGCYLPPRVLTGVDHSMAVMKEETFGPLIGIMPYENEDEAIELVNDSRYGLTASVWTQDREHAIRIGDRLEVGTVYMNRCDAVDPDLPWIGVKASGLGFTLSHMGILAMTRPKSFNLRD